MLTMQKVEETLRGLSRDYAGDHLNAGVILGQAIKRLREADEKPTGARVTFRHGPVTITVEGLPESIKPTAVSLVDVHVHASTYNGRKAQHEAFVAHFRDLGGSETFPLAEITKPFSVHSRVVGVDDAGASTRFVSRLQLYPPKRDHPEAHDVVPAIADALDREWIERTADGAAAMLREAGS
jgi:hypothetical protein